MRVCLATDVLVAAFATRGLCADVVRTVLAEHELILGDVILTELQRVLTAKLKVPRDLVAAIEGIFAPRGSGGSGQADVLVMGDEDLLVVAAEAPMRILTPRAFWELLRRPEPR